MDISKIKVKFGGKNEPKDEKLIELLMKAYSGELFVRVALIKIEGIKPFSDFQPDISPEFRIGFENKEKQNKPPPIYVYPSTEYFVMSDDYRTYYMYKEKRYSKIMCILLGDSESEFIIEKSKPFILPPLKVKVIDKGN
mgnify:CR=1 FL=1